MLVRTATSVLSAIAGSGALHEEAVHELRGDVRCVRRASPVSENEQLPAFPEGLGDELDHFDDLLGVLPRELHLDRGAILEDLYDGVFHRILLKNRRVLYGKKDKCQGKNRDVSSVRLRQKWSSECRGIYRRANFF